MNEATLGLQPDLPLFSEAATSQLTAWAPANWPAADDWQPVLKNFFASSTGQALGGFVQSRLEAGAVVYPPQPLTALALTPLQQVRVVIIGQDPYHGAGQAHGLAFSVQPGVRVPPSLRNIYKEIERERQLGLLPPGATGKQDGCLTPWAQQGVLLLNTCLTVEDGQPAAHAKQGWGALAELLIDAVLARREPVVCTPKPWPLELRPTRAPRRPMCCRPTTLRPCRQVARRCPFWGVATSHRPTIF